MPIEEKSSKSKIKLNKDLISVSEENIFNMNEIQLSKQRVENILKMEEPEIPKEIINSAKCSTTSKEEQEPLTPKKDSPGSLEVS